MIDDATVNEEQLGILRGAIESEDSWIRAINGMLLNNIIRGIHEKMLNDPIFSMIYNAGKNTALEIVASTYVNRRRIPGLLITEKEFETLLPDNFPAIEYWNEVIRDSDTDEITKIACMIGDVSPIIKGIETMALNDVCNKVIDTLIKGGYIVPKKNDSPVAKTQKKEPEKVEHVDKKPAQLPTPSPVVVDGKFKEIKVPLDGTRKPIYEETIPEVKSNNDEWVARFPKLDKVIYLAHKAGKSIIFSELNTPNNDLKNDLILATIFPAGNITVPERYLMVDHDKIYHNDINLISNNPGVEDIYDEVVIPLCDQKAIIRMITGETTNDDITHQKVNEGWVKDIFKHVDFGAVQGLTFKDWNDLLRSLNKCAKYLKKEYRYKISQYTNPTKFMLIADTTVKQYCFGSEHQINNTKDIPFITYDPASYKDGKSFEVGVYQGPDNSAVMAGLIEQDIAQKAGKPVENS